MKNKKTLTVKQAIKFVASYACPGDFNCETWEEVETEALKHVDGVAAALEIDDEYTVVYN